MAINSFIGSVEDNFKQGNDDQLEVADTTEECTHRNEHGSCSKVSIHHSAWEVRHAGRVRLHSLSLHLTHSLSLSLFLSLAMHSSYVSRQILILQQLSTSMNEKSPLAMVAH